MEAVLARLLGKNITSLERIRGGRNSQVYRISCNKEEVYAAKFYYRRGQDDRDRLEAEFSGLRFLWDNNSRNVPRPVAADKTSGCTVYEYVEGQRISSQDVTSADIDSAVTFLGHLKQLCLKEGSHSLPMAAEACFSAQAVVANIQKRLERLNAIQNEEEPYRALYRFLKEDLTPFLKQVVKQCQTNLDKLDIAWDAELPRSERTLSPSDFGFHNALRNPDNRIIFLDFEYFGWDDPAKMIADFLLHPGMKLPVNLKQRFYSGIITHLGNSQLLDNRIGIVYPLFGIKWCLILLNEFVPELLARRGFAVNKGFNKGELQTTQLVKARQMLSKVMSEYGHFPYHS